MMHNHRDGQRSTEAEAKLEAEIEALTSQEAEAAATLKKKIPLPLKVFAILCIVAGVAILPMIGFVIVAMVIAFREGALADDSTASTVLFFALLAILALLTVAFIVFGIRLLRDKRRFAAQTAELLTGLMVAGILCDIMLFGLDGTVLFFVAFIVFLVVLTSYLDPSLADERELQRKLRDMETREDAEDGTLGRDETGKGFIALNFFNLFWIFTVCCVLGLIIETVYHFVVVDPGHYQDRAGLLFGPFSPIYGFGAVLMTVALNRFHDKNVVLIFLVSAVIGGAFEYLTSWFMQFAFGIVAWDYSGTFLSIDGRTNFVFMVMWGVLGLTWIKLLLPLTLRAVGAFPQRWRRGVTAVCAAFMLVNAVMTVQSIDCWYQRAAGKAPDTPIEEFYAKNFDDAYMANRFQSMTMEAADATRAGR